MKKKCSAAHEVRKPSGEKVGAFGHNKRRRGAPALVRSTRVFRSWYKEFRMMSVLARMWKEEDGVLSFEWVLLVTLLTIGIVGGLAAARDAIIDELGDVGQAMLALDHSMTISFPLSSIVHDSSDISSASSSAFTDAAAFTDCSRDAFNEGQAPRELDDNPS